MATNYLIGRGELLTDPIGPPARKVDKAHPYETEQARDRLLPRLRGAITDFETNRDFAPDEVFVAKFVLHPSYTAKSYHPAAMLRLAGLEIVGSRERSLSVERHTAAAFSPEKTYSTSELFVAGTLSRFDRLAGDLDTGGAVPAELEVIRQFETIESFPAAEKLKVDAATAAPDGAYELVVHLPTMAPNTKSKLLELAASLGVRVSEETTFDVGSLWFVPVFASPEAIAQLAAFTTIRVARPMPRLSVEPIVRSVPGPEVQLPAATQSDPNIRVAILDGGLPAEHPFEPWLEEYREMNPEAAPLPHFVDHGMAVTSAFLFGTVEDGELGTPPSKVTVIRVLDEETAADDPLQLYSVLEHVEEVLLSRAYEHVNISLGPDLPIEDTDVHAWTSVIDDRLSDGQTFLTVAAGNNGDLDRESGNARVQVPGDAVNVLTVGAANSRGDDWDRAHYSAVGPGRLPGRTKPDVLAFGGKGNGPGEAFHVIDADGRGSSPTAGTSLAAPLALRQAVGIRRVLGGGLDPLALRALLIHSADRRDLHIDDVGWGRIPDNIDDFIVNGDGVARIIYQGELRPGKYVRAEVPMPASGLQGNVQLTATLCFATAVDAASPDVYTRASLEPVFRPDIHKFEKDAKTPKSKSFFPKLEFVAEAQQRSDFHKWEPILHASVGMKGTTLKAPYFDIHYNAREQGGVTANKEPLHYALVITIRAPKHVNLHQDILAAYPGVLVPIEPTVGVEVPGA